jgi:hypothetical protein
MFSRIFDKPIVGGELDPDRLGRLFDLAMTKKLAVIKLPPPFWMADSKINPRADHLYWTALLLGDTERAALAVSALAVEHEHGESGKTKTQRTSLAECLDRLTLALTERMDAADSELIGRIRTTAAEVRP